jgi:hypothetical protein
MTFSPKVFVFSPAGTLAYQVHAERAARLIESHRARAIGSGKAVRNIQLLLTLGSPTDTPTDASIGQYMGQRYTFREAVGTDGTVGHCATFKYIHPKDRPLFRLSVTDCLSDRWTPSGDVRASADELAVTERRELIDNNRCPHCAQSMDGKPRRERRAHIHTCRANN